MREEKKKNEGSTGLVDYALKLIKTMISTKELLWFIVAPIIQVTIYFLGKVHIPYISRFVLFLVPFSSLWWVEILILCLLFIISNYLLYVTLQTKIDKLSLSKATFNISAISLMHFKNDLSFKRLELLKDSEPSADMFGLKRLEDLFNNRGMAVTQYNKAVTKYNTKMNKLDCAANIGLYGFVLEITPVNVAGENVEVEIEVEGGKFLEGIRVPSIPNINNFPVMGPDIGTIQFPSKTHEVSYSNNLIRYNVLRTQNPGVPIHLPLGKPGLFYIEAENDDVYIDVSISSRNSSVVTKKLPLDLPVKTSVGIIEHEKETKKYYDSLLDD